MNKGLNNAPTYPSADRGWDIELPIPAASNERDVYELPELSANFARLTLRTAKFWRRTGWATHGDRQLGPRE